MQQQKERKTFNYRTMPDFDFVIEESGSNSLNLRKIAWNSVEGDGKPYKLDLRKYSYSDGEEHMMKGCTISDKGADELTGVLVEQGYGDTKRIVNALRHRDNFKQEMLEDDYEEDDGSEDYYDPKQLLSLDE